MRKLISSYLQRRQNGFVLNFENEKDAEKFYEERYPFDRKYLANVTEMSLTEPPQTDETEEEPVSKCEKFHYYYTSTTLIVVVGESSSFLYDSSLPNPIWFVKPRRWNIIVNYHPAVKKSQKRCSRALGWIGRAPGKRTN